MNDKVITESFFCIMKKLVFFLRIEYCTVKCSGFGLVYMTLQIFISSFIVSNLLSYGICKFSVTFYYGLIFFCNLHFCIRFLYR